MSISGHDESRSLIATECRIVSASLVGHMHQRQGDATGQSGSLVARLKDKVMQLANQEAWLPV